MLDENSEEGSASISSIDCKHSFTELDYVAPKKSVLQNHSARLQRRLNLDQKSSKESTSMRSRFQDMSSEMM